MKKWFIENWPMSKWVVGLCFAALGLFFLVNSFTLYQERGDFFFVAIQASGAFTCLTGSIKLLTIKDEEG